jgi:hypothetical protein
LDATPDILQLNLYDELCIISDSFLVEYGPSNAILTGPGLSSDGYFRPWQAGIGEHILTLSTNSGFCNVSISDTVKIFDESYVSFGDIDNICQNENPILWSVCYK